MSVPQGVRRTGSHETVPVSIVVTAPSDNRMRCRPAWAAPSSLQAMRCVGLVPSGQSTI